jgi:hypothetical protein
MAAAAKLSDAALLAFFASHPELRDRMASVVDAVENADGSLEEADAAEERLVEEMRLLGRQAMHGWAASRIEATEREVRLQPGIRRQGKKTPVAHKIRRDRGRRTPISVEKQSRAPVPAERQSQPARLLAAFAARHRGLRRRPAIRPRSDEIARTLRV